MPRNADDRGVNPAFLGYFCGACFVALLIVLWLLLTNLPKLTAYGAASVTIAALVLVGILAATAAFGILRSTGVFKGRRWNLAFELGGPAALIGLILTGGLLYERSIRPRDLAFSVYFHEVGKPTERLKQNGVLNLHLDNPEHFPINDGIASPQHIELRWSDSPVAFDLDMAGYKLHEPSKLAISAGAQLDVFVDPISEPVVDRVLKIWKTQQFDFMQKHGAPGIETQRVSVWYQFFGHGLIIYDVTNDYSYVLNYDEKTYYKTKNELHLISEHWSTTPPDRTLFEKLLGPRVADKDREAYWQLIEQQNIIGGIGTLFVRDALLNKLGKPLQEERHIQDVLLMPGPLYDVVVNMVNARTDAAENVDIRAVVVLFHGSSAPNDFGGANAVVVGTFEKHTVWVNGPQ
jgi:hypothetical protein